MHKKFVCHTPLAPSVLHDRGPQLQHWSPWALGTCVPTLPSTSSHGQLEGRGLSYRVMDRTRENFLVIIINEHI